MSPRKLARAVALATGETLAEIHRRGFSVADPHTVNFDPEPSDLPPTFIDWDEIDARRVSLFP